MDSMATLSRQASSSNLLSCSAAARTVGLEGNQLLNYEQAASSDLTMANIIASHEDRAGEIDKSTWMGQAINPGYTSDDESSDNEGPQDSGRTRSSTRRANQIKEKDKEEAPARATRGSDRAAQSNEGKGKKRKKTGPGGDKSGSESDDGHEKRPCAESVVSLKEELVCLCPKDVMTCIGILPSHPIVGHFHDSDDSDSSCNDDLTHTVLPTVNRNRREGNEG